MSHELEIINGTAVALGRDDAWHHLNKVNGTAFGIEEIERDAPQILMPVTLIPIETIDPFHNWSAFDGTGAAVRQDGHVVGINGSRYELVQGAEAFELGTQTGLDCISAISLRGGRQQAFTFDLGSYEVGGEAMQDYISVLNSFDGSWSLIALKSTTVIVCANTAAMALSGASTRFNIRHTASWEEKVDDVREALGLAVESRTKFVETVEHLMRTPFNMRQFDALLDGIKPLPDQQGRGRTMAEQARSAIRGLYTEGEVTAAWRNTAWGAVQAVNTYEQWSAPVRKTAGLSSASVRATRQIDALASGKGDALTSKAVTILGSQHIRDLALV